jgi:hypothetical protein
LENIKEQIQSPVFIELAGKINIPFSVLGLIVLGGFLGMVCLLYIK